MKIHSSGRREFIGGACNLSLFMGLAHLLPSYAWGEITKHARAQEEIGPFDLTIGRTPFDVNGRTGSAVTINGTVPGPMLRFREGQEAIIRVTNKLSEATSIHWHGVLVPPQMDGVPGVSFAGIKPGETFTYRFPVHQSGTYWYHSHSGGQELEGMYGPLIIDPAVPDPYKYDREYVIVLSDWSFMDPITMIGKLKKQSSYFNYQKRTMADFIHDVRNGGLVDTFSERSQWAKMRMDPTDISDVTGATYNYLINGLSPEGNWTGLFRKGERIRLRFIDAGAMTIFDVRIPGLKMTVVQADGQNVQPVLVEEFRIAPGETYDVIIEPKNDEPYSVFAETIDRSGYAFGTLASKAGMKASIPERRRRPIRSMGDMGMGMAMTDMPGMKMEKQAVPKDDSMPGMEMSHSAQSSISKSEIPGAKPVKHGSDTHGPGNSAVPMETKNRLHEPGTGMENNTRRVLVYTDLKTIKPFEDQRTPEREIELHLTGNMERYMWSIDGKTYSESSDPIPFNFGERLRLTFVNDTMMEHPMHLHGMWMYLENGSGSFLPRKHTIIVKPAERLSVVVTADALGDWAFHCHMLIHMEMGMFRVVRVANRKPEVKS
ncbi:MAG: copper resistance protein CopA [Bdellovibrio sp. 28-41-41]|nr:MAG: copper resistance protein CopA [Bdellovibrio sp. 28-41-41]